MILDDLSQAIGRTPLLRLARFGRDAPATLLAKLELLNPFSIKDRAVARMIDEAAAQGALEAGGTIVEATSGNTGMAVAMLAVIRGYRACLVMSEIQSLERRQVLGALGADLRLTPASKGTRGAREEAKRLAKEHGWFYLGQHDNPANAAAHEATTGPELWEATDGQIDVLVSGLGTGGTLMGCARAIKARKPSFMTVGVEPAQAPFISQGRFAPHRIMGTAPGFEPGILDRSLVDRIELIEEEEAFSTVRELARTEGLLCGISCGATAAVARRLAQEPEMAGKTIVCVIADSGQRYLSVSGLFS